MSTRLVPRITAPAAAGAVVAALALTVPAVLTAAQPAAAAGSAAAGSARAHRAAGPAAPTRLVLTVTGAGVKSPRDVILGCDPPSGTHPHPARACAAVAAADGRLAGLKPTPGVLCTMEYAPTTASATGTWRGRAVHYRHTFSNGCLMGVRTGSVFQF